MTLQPLGGAVMGALFREIGPDAAANSIQFVTAAATLGFKEPASLSQFRDIRYVALLVATATGGANVFAGEKRSLPEGDVAVGC